MDLVRVLVLVCCCLLSLGSYYCFDLPGALPDDFRKILAENDPGKQGLFYSMYSLPNTVQPFVGGIVIDKVLGLRLGATICCSLVAIGCAIVAFAASVPAWSGASTAFIVGVSGRFVFGLGGETLAVCQNAFCAKWFRGADLATAFAIVLSFARVGSAINFAIEPKLAAQYSFSFALWVSAGFCVISLLSCFLLSFLDARYEHLTVEEDEDDDDAFFDMDERLEESTREENAPRLQEALLENGDAGLLEERLLGEGVRHGSEGDLDLLANRAPVVERTHQGVDANKATDGGIWFSLKQVIGLRELLIYFICVQFYVAVFVFIAVASKFLTDTYDDVDAVSAGLLVSVPYTVSAIASPLLGMTMDKVGRGLLFVGLACLSLLGVHATFAFIPHAVSPMGVMVWLGITYSTCAASLWPMIAVVVESKFISTSYGLMMSLQNTGLALAPAIVMKLIPDQGSDPDTIAASYRTIELIFSACAAGALLCTVVLYFVDMRSGGELSAPASSSDDTPMAGRPSPRINPLNPRASPFLRRASFPPPREAVAPRTPHAVRRKYFRKLRVQAHI
ncbi:Major facilitator superfamily domain-containing protein 1 [Hondaea fermentalgiana]|uniref:Lysosomal dipeptide transporter MFSD1 n=1 Tax=Hondaea fermentalgiana TaxID=2315210 RepID=A0A2R5GLE5_9STRA|nr:Major facilitator superfamily domain-containing protein 1 [Hondaea fermentalgiana]|eukprot:GBG31455.1 Major facilitator superfamily domain-containing protein 1 [Hondaea fermentalgiana]